MKRSRLKNIINKSKELSNKLIIGESPFDKFKKSLPIEIDDNYRLESAWKAYGSPKNYKEALWYGLIQPIDDNNIILPSIGYNEETDEYEYLNKGRDNEIVNKDIRAWDNDVIPLIKELKLGGYIRIFDEENDCWKYQKGGKSKLEKRKLLLGTENPEIVVNNAALEKLKQKEELQQKILQGQADFNGSLMDETDAENERFNFEMSDGYDWYNYLKYIDFLKTHNIDPGDYIHWALQNKSSKKISPKDYLESKGLTFIFKQGGQILQNIIPEGSLHARKNGMELAEKGEITPKGIPVVDNEGNLQAEIEKEEIIFNKNTTDKLENLYKKYNSDEISLAEKDEIAIKAGKLLSILIIENTDDRTGLIQKIADK